MAEYADIAAWWCTLQGCAEHFDCESWATSSDQDDALESCNDWMPLDRCGQDGNRQEHGIPEPEQEPIEVKVV